MKDFPIINQIIELINDINRNNTLTWNEVLYTVERKLNEKRIESIISLYQLFEEAHTRLFTYGSLQPGQQNNYLLKDLGGEWLDGFVYGSLTLSTTGSSAGFLLLTPDYSTFENQVTGKLLTSQNLTTNWKVLDEFEGEDYVRHLIPVYSRTNDKIIIAHTYVVNSNV